MRRLLIAGWGLTLLLTPAPVLGPGVASAEDSARTRGPGAFAEAGAMKLHRFGHGTAVLPDGRVLVVGGEAEGGATKKVELWDPATETFSGTGPLSKGRSFPGVVALPDGRVLVIGGESPSGILRSAEIRDPGSGEFNATGKLRKPRFRSDGVALPDGRVVIAGGSGRRGYLRDIEAWDPESGRFRKVGQLPEPRALHTTTLLPDGRVLLVGGLAEKRGRVTVTLAQAHLLDPATGSVSETGSMHTGRSHHTATLLPDGRVLVAGGDDQDRALPSAEIWDPATGAFTETGSMAQPRRSHTATALPDGRVLVAGGSDDEDHLATTEVWDPATGEFTVSGPLIDGRSDHSAELLPDGRVLVLGGIGRAAGIRAAEAWDSAATYEDPAPPASLDLASCAGEADELTSELVTGFPSTMDGAPLAPLACRGSDWLAMHEAADPAAAATIERASQLLQAAGRTVDDLAIATARREGASGEVSTITALRVDGAQAADLEDRAVPLLLGIERPAYRHRSVGRNDIGVVEVRDETIAGAEPTTIYAPVGDTLWFVTATGPELLADIVEALPGPGGRFEAPSLGAAITFPEDWRVAPTPERVGRNDDMGSGAVEWMVASGSAPPSDEDVGGGCWLKLFRPSDLTAEQAMKRLAGGGRKAPEPEVLEDGLIRLAGPGSFFGADVDSAVYVLAADGAVAALMCVASEGPDDLWLTIARSIELFAP